MRDAPNDVESGSARPSNEARPPRRDAAREESAELRWLCRLEERTNAIQVDDPPRCGLSVVKPKPLMAVRPPLKPPFPKPEAEPEPEPEPQPAPEPAPEAPSESVPEQAPEPAAAQEEIKQIPIAGGHDDVLFPDAPPEKQKVVT